MQWNHPLPKSALLIFTLKSWTIPGLFCEHMSNDILNTEFLVNFIALAYIY